MSRKDDVLELLKKEPLTRKEIARELSVGTPALSLIFTNLVHKNVIRNIPDGNKKRNLKLTLVKKKVDGARKIFILKQIAKHRSGKLADVIPDRFSGDSDTLSELEKEGLITLGLTDVQITGSGMRKSQYVTGFPKEVSEIERLTKEDETTPQEDVTSEMKIVKEQENTIKHLQENIIRLKEEAVTRRAEIQQLKSELKDVPVDSEVTGHVIQDRLIKQLMEENKWLKQVVENFSQK